MSHGVITVAAAPPRRRASRSRRRDVADIGDIRPGAPLPGDNSDLDDFSAQSLSYLRLRNQVITRYTTRGGAGRRPGGAFEPFVSWVFSDY